MQISFSRIILNRCVKSEERFVVVKNQSIQFITAVVVTYGVNNFISIIRVGLYVRVSL